MSQAKKLGAEIINELIQRIEQNQSSLGHQVPCRANEKRSLQANRQHSEGDSPDFNGKEGLRNKNPLTKEEGNASFLETGPVQRAYHLNSSQDKENNGVLSNEAASQNPTGFLKNKRVHCSPAPESTPY